MQTYTLPKTGGLARLDVLNDADLFDVLALQETTRAALPDAMKMFILPQPTGYFSDLLTRKTGVMIGIRNDGRLIAQMAVMGPMPLRQAIAANAITKSRVPFHHAALTDSVIVFKSVVVHPDWRGNDLAAHLLSFALDLPIAQLTNHVFAQVSAANKRSWDVFTRHKFGIVAADYDPADSAPRFVFQRPAFGFDFEPEVIADDVHHVDDFPAIVRLTQRDGLVGVYDEKNPGSLCFMRSRDLLTLVPTLARIQA